MQPLPFKYKIKRGKCVIESNSTNTTIDLRTDDIIGDINGYNMVNNKDIRHDDGIRYQEG